MKRALLPCGVILLVALLVSCAASFVWHVDVFVGDWHVGVLTASAHLVHDKTASALWPVTFSSERVASVEWTALHWRPRWTSGARYQVGILPLWIPLTAIAIPIALLHRAKRRPSPPGSCPRCHYNLTGNTSGFCPECGHAMERRT